MDSKCPVAEHEDWLRETLAIYALSSLQWLLCTEGSESHTINSVCACQVLWSKGSQKTKQAVSDPRWLYLSRSQATHPPSHSGKSLSLKSPFCSKAVLLGREHDGLLVFHRNFIFQAGLDWCPKEKTESQTPRPEPRELPRRPRVVSVAVLQHHWPPPNCLQPHLLLPMKTGVWIFAQHCVIGCFHACKRAPVPFLPTTGLLPV